MTHASPALMQPPATMRLMAEIRARAVRQVTAAATPDHAPSADTQPATEAPMRHDLILRIAEQIAQGHYETPDKLDQAMDRLLEELDLPRGPSA